MEKLIPIIPYKRVELHRNGTTLTIYPMRYTWDRIQMQPVCYCECVVKLHNRFFKVSALNADNPVRVHQILDEVYDTLSYSPAMNISGTRDINRDSYLQARTRDMCSRYMASRRHYELLCERNDMFFMYTKRLAVGLNNIVKIPRLYRIDYKRTIYRFREYIEFGENENLCPHFSEYLEYLEGL